MRPSGRFWREQKYDETGSVRFAGSRSGRSFDGSGSVFELNYLENRGAAFGMLQGQKGIFLVSTVLVLALIALYYHRAPLGKRFVPVRVIGVLLLSGALGNMIDRVLQSYVVDFLYVKLIDFPVFNVADCYVTVGAVLMAVLFLFYYKDEELGFLNPFGKGESHGNDPQV